MVVFVDFTFQEFGIRFVKTGYGGYGVKLEGNIAN